MKLSADSQLRHTRRQDQDESEWKVELERLNKNGKFTRVAFYLNEFKFYENSYE